MFPPEARKIDRLTSRSIFVPDGTFSTGGTAPRYPLGLRPFRESPQSSTYKVFDFSIHQIWSHLVAFFPTSIKKGGFFGQSLKEFKTSLKGKLSYEEMFKLAASCCGLNPARFSQELCLNNVNWEKVVETLVQTSEESKEEKKVEIPVENPAPATIKKAKKTVEKKTAVKAIKSDPRSKSITLVNEKTGEVKTWSSYRACEKELYGDDKKGHGTVSQLLNPKKGLKRLPGGWVLPKEEEKTHKIERAHKRAVIQMKKDKRGRLRTVNTFNSITEASGQFRGSGIPPRRSPRSQILRTRQQRPRIGDPQAFAVTLEEIWVLRPSTRISCTRFRIPWYNNRLFCHC